MNLGKRKTGLSHHWIGRSHKRSDVHHGWSHSVRKGLLHKHGKKNYTQECLCYLLLTMLALLRAMRGTTHLSHLDKSHTSLIMDSSHKHTSHNTSVTNTHHTCSSWTRLANTHHTCISSVISKQTQCTLTHSHARGSHHCLSFSLCLTHTQNCD